LGRAAAGLGLAALLLWLTWRRAAAGPGVEWAAVSWPRLALAFLAYGAVVGCCALRWGVLLRVQGIRLPFRQLLRLTLIGNFFNLALPGAVGGDLVKMALIARRCPAKNAESVFSIVVDRIFGLLGLFTLAAAMVLANLGGLLALDGRFAAVKAAALAVGGGALAAVGGVVVVELHGRLLRFAPVRRGVAAAAKRLPARLVTVVTRLARALDQYRRARAALALAFALSLAVHFTLALLLFLIGRGLGEGALPFSGYLLAAQIANAVASIPLTPSGVGLRDFTVAAFLEAFHGQAAAAAAIPLAQTVIFTAWGLVGGVVFAVAGRPPAAAAGKPG
jgi:hypothetical protein